VRDRPPPLRMVAVEPHGKDLPGEFVVTVPLLRQAVQGPGPPPESGWSLSGCVRKWLVGPPACAMCCRGASVAKIVRRTTHGHY
jgi:hypothetical protein